MIEFRDVHASYDGSAPILKERLGTFYRLE